MQKLKVIGDVLPPGGLTKSSRIHIVEVHNTDKYLKIVLLTMDFTHTHKLCCRGRKES